MLLLIIGAAMAQDSIPPVKKKIKPVFGGDGVYLRDSTWKIGGYAGILLNQTALYQWGPGGFNSFSFTLGGNFYANYKKGKLIADNSLDAKWGLIAVGLIRHWRKPTCRRMWMC